jgi:U4/U6.U5 tri-snRNP-associated protein 3
MHRSHMSSDHAVPKRDQPARRSRSRSPVRNGDSKQEQARSPPRGPRTDHDRQRGKERDKPAVKPEPEIDKKVKPEPERKPDTKPAVNGDAMAVDEDEEDAMLRRMMGFVAFNTTHNKKVPGNQIYGVRKEKKTEYRQYMNRVGGFNRPLSPSRS